MTTVGFLLLWVGVAFLGLGAVGIVRFPDLYTRLHAMGKSDTLGAVLSLSGLALIHGTGPAGLKVVLVVLFVAIANPAATHAIGRAAWVSGLAPWVAEEGEEQP